MILNILLIIVGFTSLIFGANWLVDGSSALAKKNNVSDLVIGLTIVAFGTSAPELVVNIIGSINGYTDIVVGNIVGSNNFNLFVILGISGLIIPITVQSSTAWKEIPISFFVTIILFLLLTDFRISSPGILTRYDSLFLLTLFSLFLFYIFLQLKKEPITHMETIKQSNLRIWSLILVGLTGLIVGGNLVVTHSIQVASSLGLSEKIIGLTIIAAGTSLPELITSVVAATKKNSDIAIGNVIGSNIFNILFILSLSGIISPVRYKLSFNTDFYILLGGTLFLFGAMFFGGRKRLERWEAFTLLAFYIGYTLFLIKS